MTMTLPSLAPDMFTAFNAFLSWDIIKAFIALVLALVGGGFILHIVANRLIRS